MFYKNKCLFVLSLFLGVSLFLLVRLYSRSKITHTHSVCVVPLTLAQFIVFGVFGSAFQIVYIHT